MRRGRWLLTVVISAALCGCASNTNEPESEPTVRRKRERQAKFKPEDFKFVRKQDIDEHGVFGACLLIPMRDQSDHLIGCDLGIVLPILVYGETWPRDEEDAAEYSAKAANSMRKHLLSLEHADKFSCRVFVRQIQGYLNNSDRRQRKAQWPGADTMFCNEYQGSGLPEFYFKRGHLLVGDFREWHRTPLEP